MEGKPLARARLKEPGYLSPWLHLNWARSGPRERLSCRYYANCVEQHKLKLLLIARYQQINVLIRKKLLNLGFCKFILGLND